MDADTIFPEIFTSIMYIVCRPLGRGEGEEEEGGDGRGGVTLLLILI